MLEGQEEAVGRTEVQARGGVPWKFRLKWEFTQTQGRVQDATGGGRQWVEQ